MLVKLNESSATNMTPMQSDISPTSQLKLSTSLQGPPLESILSDIVGYNKESSEQQSQSAMRSSPQEYGFEEQVLKQRRQIARKMQVAMDVEAFMGPL